MNFSSNIKRTIIFGDIHGCLDELLLSLDSLKYDESTDRLIFAGDLVDRGPSSGGVVDFVKNGKHECVKGNHDDKHVRYFKHAKLKRENPNYKNPVNLSDDKRKAHSQLTDDHLEWMTELPTSIYIKTHNLLVIHAGVLPYKHPLHQPNDIYMYCRYIDINTYKTLSLGSDFRQPKNSIFWADAYEGDVNIVYGHNVHDLSNPYVTTNKKGYKTYGIDTGCVFGGNLTSLIIENNEFKFHQTKALKNYYLKH